MIAVIEDLLDIEAFSTMNLLLKIKYLSKQEVNLNELEMSKNENAIELQED